MRKNLRRIAAHATLYLVCVACVSLAMVMGVLILSFVAWDVPAIDWGLLFRIDLVVSVVAYLKMSSDLEIKELIREHIGE